MSAGQSPTVSVVVPNYNHARYLRQRIDSILAQTFTDFELILLDDCSTDNSREILQCHAGDPRVKLHFNGSNSGSTFKQWNKGAALATGKYLWLAESDDFAAPTFLQRLLPILEADEKCAVAYCHSFDVDESGKSRGLLRQWVAYPDPAHWDADFVADGELEIQTNFVWGTPIQNGSAALIRRSAFLAVGGADESYRLAGDWKLYIDLLATGKLAYVAEPLNYYRRHGVTVRSASRSSGLDVEEAYRIFNHLRSKVTLPPSVVERRLWQLARWRAEMPGRSQLSKERRAALAKIASQSDPNAQWRFAVARARSCARSVRDMFAPGRMPVAGLGAMDLSDLSRCQATVVITTRNRKEDLCVALASCLTQDVPLEVLVIDDASTDGTAELVRDEFPTVRLERSESAMGYIFHRNRGAELAQTPVIISIDDDAIFTAPDIVRKTLAAFDDPRVGAVAIPFVNVNESPQVMQLAPDEKSVCVIATYIGTAHALRRDLFLQLNGYRVFFYSQFEEHDYCLRMLQAGYVVRLGCSAVIHHMQSPRRQRRQIVIYGMRNQILVATLNFPLRFLPRTIPAVLWHGLRTSQKHGFPMAVVWGWMRGCAETFRHLGQRRPVSAATVRRSRAIGAARGTMRLEPPT